MGGLARDAPGPTVRSSSAPSRWRPSRRSPASSRRTPSSRASSTREPSAGSCGRPGSPARFLTGLYTFRLLFIVFFREVSPFAREHLHRERFEVRCRWPVAILAVLDDRRVPPGARRLVTGRRLAVRWSSRSSDGALALFLDSRLAAASGGIAVAWSPLSKARRPPGLDSRALPGSRPGPSSTSSTSTRPTTSSSTAQPRRSRPGCCGGSRPGTPSSAPRRSRHRRPRHLRPGRRRADRPRVACLRARARPRARRSSESSSSSSRDPDDPHPASDRRGPRDLDRPVEHLEAAGGFALLVALGELALWVGAALNFDFGASGLQEEVDVTWISRTSTSPTRSAYDYSLWLVGLTAVVTAAAVG